MARALVLPQPAECDWLYLLENALISAIVEVWWERAKFSAIARETQRDPARPRQARAPAAVLISAGRDVICSRVRCKWEKVGFFLPSSRFV